MSEKQQIENEFGYDCLVWEATDYFARTWNAEKDKPLEKLVEDTRGFLERNYVVPSTAKTIPYDTPDKEILALDEDELSLLARKLHFGENNVEKKMDNETWRLSNVVRKEIHDCLGIWLTIFKPGNKLQFNWAEMKEQAERMKKEDPFSLYHSLHRQRRERVDVEAAWVDKRDSVNLIIDPIAATESQGKILSVIDNEWDQPYTAEMELYAGLDKGLVNLFSLNNFTIVHFDANFSAMKNKLTDLGFAIDCEGIFVKGSLRIRLKNQGSNETSSNIHVNARTLDTVLDERFDLVLRATDITTASRYGLVAAEMRHGLMNSHMLPDFVELLDGIKNEIPFAVHNQLGTESLTVRHKLGNRLASNRIEADE